MAGRQCKAMTDAISAYRRAAGTLSLREVARRFGVSPSALSVALRRTA